MRRRIARTKEQRSDAFRRLAFESLGARRCDILRLILTQTALPVVLGLAVGLASSFARSRLLTGMLYEVRPSDPLTYAAASLLLAGVAALAAYWPARRAAKVDPAMALRFA